MCDIMFYTTVTIKVQYNVLFHSAAQGDFMFFSQLLCYKIIMNINVYIFIVNESGIKCLEHILSCFAFGRDYRYRMCVQSVHVDKPNFQQFWILRNILEGVHRICRFRIHSATLKVRCARS